MVKGVAVPGRFAAVVGIAIAAGACTVTWSGPAAGSKHAISIGVDLPESGDAASSGLATLNGVRFAVQKSGGSVGGWTLTVENRDDAVGGTYNVDKGVQNVADLVSTDAVVAMVGPFNSSVARAEIPIAAPAHLAMISPSNTNPCLTKNLGEPLCAYSPGQLRRDNPNDYFRVISTDDLQGPTMADYAYRALGSRRVGIIDDRTVYGVFSADAFQAEFQSKGGAADRESFDPTTTTDWRPMLNEFRRFGATAVYVGGIDQNSACKPRAQMAALGIGDWPYLGTDAMMSVTCIDDAGASAAGIATTTAGADAVKTASAASAIADFGRAFPSSAFSFYTLYAYDAANIEIAAIKKALEAGKDPRKVGEFREAVRANVARTSGFEGSLGTTTFDANGDTLARTFSVYETKEGVASRVLEYDGPVCKKAGQPGICFEWVQQLDASH